MGTAQFGRLVRAAMDEQGLKQATVGRRVTKRLADDRGLDSTQIRLVLEGKRRLDADLVQAFIDVLGLDPAEAWEAALEPAGLKPPGFTADSYRRFRIKAVHAAPSRTRSNPTRHPDAWFADVPPLAPPLPLRHRLDPVVREAA